MSLPSPRPPLRERLLARQPTAELARKAVKARRWRQKRWTQEEVDGAERRAAAVALRLGWTHAPRPAGGSEQNSFAEL